MLKEDNELLSRLKDFSLTIYQHGLQIGDLSSRAALIGADEMLASRGLYHEIGKQIFNYIEEGLKLAEEYKFPKKLMESFVNTTSNMTNPLWRLLLSCYRTMWYQPLNIENR